MKNDRKKAPKINLADQMVWFGFGLAITYWGIEIFLEIFLRYDVELLDLLVGNNLGEILNRIIVLCLFVIFGSHAQYTINERKKAEHLTAAEAATRARFQRLLSPDLAEMVVSGDLKVEQGGETRVATVMFMDIRDFTAMTESSSASEMLELLNEYYEMMTSIVFRHHGTVDKYIGDSMMAIWGAPLVSPDDPERAVRASVDALEALVGFNQKRSEMGRQVVRVGIGISTGELVAGYIGSSLTMGYSVIGTPVNIAARLCDAAKPGQVMICENTYRKMKDALSAVEMDPLQAKGISKPIRVYNVICEQCYLPPPKYEPASDRPQNDLHSRHGKAAL